jgi:ABC-type sulfate transport system permease component
LLLWLTGVVVFVVLWGGLWRSQPKAAFGVLLGLPLAWIFSRLMTPYVTGMNEIPLWLPPLPLAIVAVTLFVFGAIIWFRADKLPPPKRSEEHDDQHSVGHSGHGQH